MRQDARSRPTEDERQGPAPGAQGADRTRTATVDGRPLVYATYGARTGTPVVLFHGTPGSRLLGELYDAAARERDVRLLVPDRPGFGRSPAWEDRTLADGARIAAAVLDDAGVASAGVVGFSGGGAQALAAAALGDRVTGVDLLSTAVPPHLRAAPPLPQRLLEGTASHAPRLLRTVVRFQAWLAERRPSLAVAQLTADPDAVPARAATLAARDFLEGVGPSCRGLVTETRQLGTAWDLPRSAVSVPVRLWHGADDANVPVAGARRFAETLPDATATVLADADHLTTLLSTRGRVLDRQVADRR